MCAICFVIVFFFFQAEDGIRDYKVTGVQTCALPISPEAKPQWEERIRTADTQGMEPLVEPTLGRWFTPPFREREPEVVERVRAMIRGTKPAGYIGCCRAIAGLDLTDRVGAIKLPTLVIVGEEAEEHTSELQSPCNLVCRLLLEKKKTK